MAKVTINQDKCKGCFLCVYNCSKKLIKKSDKLNKKGFVCVEFEDNGKCAGCAMCALMCPDCCIEVEK